MSDVDVYLTDDASSDGTSEIVQSQFPSVHIIKGDGNLFWNRGMHLAWSEAIKVGYDFYVWLNDDVILKPYFMEELFHTYSLAGKLSIVSGIIIDIEDGQVIYGGTEKKKRVFLF